jgi:hypothetical protein
MESCRHDSAICLQTGKRLTDGRTVASSICLFGVVWGAAFGAARAPHAGTESRGFPQIIEKVTLAPGQPPVLHRRLASSSRSRPEIDHGITTSSASSPWCCAVGWASLVRSGQPLVLHRWLSCAWGPGSRWWCTGDWVSSWGLHLLALRRQVLVLLGVADVSSASSCWCFTGGWGTSLTSRAASAWALTFRRRAAVGVSPAAGILFYTRAASAWALTFRRRQLLVLHRRLAHFIHNTGCFGLSADVSSAGSCWCFTGGWATPSTRRGRFGPSSGCGAPRSALRAHGRCSAC